MRKPLLKDQTTISYHQKIMENYDFRSGNFDTGFLENFKFKPKQKNGVTLNIPEDLIYTEEHEWVRVIEENAIVGITDFAQSQLGDIIFLELPDADDKIIAGEPFGEIEAVKTVSELYAPVDGTVIEVNNNLEDFLKK